MDRPVNPDRRHALLGLAIPTFTLWIAAAAGLIQLGGLPWWSAGRLATLERFRPVVRWAGPVGNASLAKADQAGRILPADRIVSIDGQPFRPGDWDRLRRRSHPGKSAAIGVVRRGQPQTVAARFSLSVFQTVVTVMLVLAVPIFCFPILLANPGWFTRDPAGLIRVACAASLSAVLLSLEPALFAGWSAFWRGLLWIWTAAMAAIGPYSWWRLLESWLGEVKLHRHAERMVLALVLALGALGGVLSLTQGFWSEAVAAAPSGFCASAIGIAEACRGRLEDLVWIVFLLVGLTARWEGSRTSRLSDSEIPLAGTP